MTLRDLNSANNNRAAEALLACCGSSVWANSMIAQRPFAGVQALHDTAESVWRLLTPADWLQAFSKHPRIGENTPNKWSSGEQAGMSQVPAATAEIMRDLNEQYERKFGFIFIVCATGKSADSMHLLLEQRLQNDRQTELDIASIEQARIMHLRLDKLLAE